MAFELTETARLAALKRSITPNIVVEIDGLSSPIGSVAIDTAEVFGEPGLVFGGGAVFGGVTTIEDQQTLINLNGSSTSIQQQLNPDKGAGSSVSSMTISFVDLNGYMTNLISPGLVLDDLLGRKATVWLGFDDTSYKEDYIIIHRGIISQIDSTAGLVNFDISHPDQKKRQDLFTKVSTELDGGINNSVTTITLAATANMFQKVLGPDSAYDSSFYSYVKIDDEIIQYDTISGNNIVGCTRGALGTVAASHDDEATVDTFYRLKGNVMDLALKLMLSGVQGNYVTGLDIEDFQATDTLFISGENLAKTWGINIGDYITTIGASNGANNVSAKQVSAITIVDGGVEITLSGVTFVSETGTSATFSVRSQYDTLPDGVAFGADEVDVYEHLRIQRLFLSSVIMDYYLKDTIVAKDFIEDQIYNPVAAYSIPRKGQASLGYTSGPLPAADIKTLSSDNIYKPSSIVLKRGLAKNFYNSIVYKYDMQADEDKFISGTITIDATSLVRIPVGNRVYTVEADGLRTENSGAELAERFSNKRLGRYKFAAEYIEQVNVLYGTSFNMEIGDLVYLDNTSLFISNTQTGVRGGGTSFYEIVNKTFDIKTGSVKLSLVNTNYSVPTRGALMSPYSIVSSGTSSTVFTIQQTGNSVFGSNEGAKWSRYTLPAVKVVSTNYTTRNDNSIISSVVGNVITLASALSFTPQAGDLLIFDEYNNSTASQHLVYGWMSDTDFDDASMQYKMF